MKKMLSFIMIAALATSGLFAVDFVEPTVRSLSASNTSLGDILLVVNNYSATDARVILKYDGSQTAAVNEINKAEWEIGSSETVANTTDIFTVHFIDGIVNAVGSSDTEYEISVVPGPFTNNADNTIIAQKKDLADNIVPLIPYAIWVDGVDEGTSSNLPTDTFLDITTTDISPLQYIVDLQVASFKFIWNSVLFTDYINAEGAYTSTSTVNITTTV